MITLKNVAFIFSDSPNKPMAFNLSINAGEKVSIIGASGSGKSTLLNLIAGFISPFEGKILLNGTDHTHSKPHQRPLSMLFQNHNLFNHLTVAQNIALAIRPNLKLSKDEWLMVDEVTESVGLAGSLAKKPNQLSGGQQQRVAIARTLLRDKPIMLLDEPFSALDRALRVEMLELLKQVHIRNKTTLLLVTHQPEELTDFVDRQIVIGT